MIDTLPAESDSSASRTACRRVARVSVTAGLALLFGPAVLLWGCRTERDVNRDTGESIVWRASMDGLHPRLLRALSRVAQQYRDRAGSPIVVTSGRRSLRRQAQLMADMSREQLEGMYCRNGYPSYVRDLVAARQKAGALTEDDAYRILRTRTEGYISSHLYGAAVDISSVGVDVALLKRLLQEQGFRTLDERNLGIQCIHATYRHIPAEIIRE
jgi:hypothetical protein